MHQVPSLGHQASALGVSRPELLWHARRLVVTEDHPVAPRTHLRHDFLEARLEGGGGVDDQLANLGVREWGWAWGVLLIEAETWIPVPASCRFTSERLCSGPKRGPFPDPQSIRGDGVGMNIDSDE